MDDNKVFKCFPVVVKDKTSTSRTSGSVSTNVRGDTVTVNNTVSTNVDLEVLLEFPNGEILPFHILNESLYAPVGSKILMAFKDGKPIAYKTSPGGAVYALGYTNEKYGLSSSEFFLMVPFVGSIIAGMLLFASETYYKNGEIVPDYTANVVAALGLGGTALAVFLTEEVVAGFFIGTPLSGIALCIAMAIFNGKANAGRKSMLEDVKNKFATMIDRLS